MSRYRVAYEYEAGSLGIVRESGSRNVPPTNVTVRTWADGFGTWHAEFTTTENAQWDVFVAKAAIRHELMARNDGKHIMYPRVARRYRKTDLPGHVHFTER